MTHCPICGATLEAIHYPSDSYLSRDQWDATKAGDLLCRECPTYWWSDGSRSERTSRLLDRLRAQAVPQ